MIVRLRKQVPVRLAGQHYRGLPARVPRRDAWHCRAESQNQIDPGLPMANTLCTGVVGFERASRVNFSQNMLNVTPLQNRRQTIFMFGIRNGTIKNCRNFYCVIEPQLVTINGPRGGLNRYIVLLTTCAWFPTPKASMVVQKPLEGAGSVVLERQNVGDGSRLRNRHLGHEQTTIQISQRQRSCG